MIEYKFRKNNKEIFDFWLEKTNNILLADFAAKRNIKNDYIINELPNPYLFKDMKHVVKMFLKWVNNDFNKIVIHGDYDNDGIHSIYVYHSIIKDLFKKEPHYSINTREEGYGLTLEVAKKLYNQGFRYIITADNGISSLEACEFLKQNGCEVIITDHHEPKYNNDIPILPCADYIIDHKIPNTGFENSELCGCGTIFMVCVAIGMKLDKSIDYFYKYLDAVSVATIVDLVGLDTDINKFITWNGIQNIRQNKFSTKTYGNFIKTILKNNNSKINGDSCGFQIGPIFNAAGRLNKAKYIVDTLCQENTTGLDFLIFISMNEERKKLTNEYFNKILEEIPIDTFKNKKFAIVTPTFEIESGFHGLLASKIEALVKKPTILMTKSEKYQTWHGSGRSYNFDLQNLFNDFPIKINGGGHIAACGISLPNSELELFLKILEEQYETDDYIIRYDNEIIFKDNKIYVHMEFLDETIKETEVTLTVNDIEEISTGETFKMIYGMNIEKPFYKIKFNKNDIKNIKILKEEHLSFEIYGYKFMNFFFKNQDINILDLYNDSTIDEIETFCNIQINEFNNKKSIQFFI